MIQVNSVVDRNARMQLSGGAGTSQWEPRRQFGFKLHPRSGPNPSIMQPSLNSFFFSPPPKSHSKGQLVPSGKPAVILKKCNNCMVPLVMHVIVWYCMVLHSVAWYCVVLCSTKIALHGNAWYCVVLLPSCKIAKTRKRVVGEVSPCHQDALKQSANHNF